MCINNTNGFCIKERDKETGKHSLIDDLVANKDNRCPEKVWDKVNFQEHSIKRTCNHCGRIHKYFADICKVCVQDLERKRRNLQRGIGSKKGLIRFKAYDENLSDDIDYSIKEDPFTGTPIKHLHYFIYPRYEESTVHHLNQLESCINQFNGKLFVVLQLMIILFKINIWIDLKIYLLKFIWLEMNLKNEKE